MLCAVRFGASGWLKQAAGPRQLVARYFRGPVTALEEATFEEVSSAACSFFFLDRV